MKKISSVLFVLIIVFSSIGAPITAHAVEIAPGDYANTAVALQTDGSWSQEYGSTSLQRAFYKLQITSQSKLKLSVKTYNNVDVVLYNSDLTYEYFNKIGTGSSSSPSVIVENTLLAAGTYYVRVNSIGKYSLKAEVGGNSYVNPEPLALNNTVSGSSTAEDDGRWFKLDTATDGKYRLQISSCSFVQADIYNSDLSVKLDTVYAYGSNTQPQTNYKDITLTPGTYLIKLQCDIEYTLCVMPFSPQICSHSYNAEYVAPTYFEKGFTLHTCSLCGASYKDNYEKAKKLKTPRLYSLKAGEKKITVNNSEVLSATGYEIQYSTSKKFTKKTTKKMKTKSSKAAVKKLKIGKKYYVRVRAYKTSGKKTVYSSFSKVKSIKAK